MHLSLAPMEGVTDTIYRRAHYETFGGTDQYYVPFIAPTQHLCFTPKEKYALSPEENRGVPTVPQILAKDGRLFLWAAREMRDRGYQEVNLNLGCPAATVTSKGKGAGMLQNLSALSLFLDQIFACPPLPISLKTRIGFESTEEWPALLSLLSQYPFSKAIIHPRLREEFYEGVPHLSCFSAAFPAFSCPVIYNGDIFRPEDGEKVLAACPDTKGLMLGRGVLSNPALLREMKGGKRLSLQEFRAFHDRLFEDYQARYDATIALLRMKALMQYMCCSFEDGNKAKKALKKANNERAYLAAADQLFSGHALKAAPGFYWEK